MKKLSIFLTVLCFACFGVANAQQSLPYSYGFENNNLTTDGWSANLSSSSSGINSAAAYSGSYGFRFNYSERSGSLISPVLTGGDRGVDVSFWYKEYSSTYGDEQFYVGYSTDASTTDVDAFTYGSIVTASTSWQKYTTSFPAGTKRIAIKYVYNDALYLYLDDFTFEAVSNCPKPRNLEVTLGDGTATATWTSDATSFNIDINGTVTNNVTNPHTFNTELSTAYTVKVQANCEGGETSDWSDAYTFNTPSCLTSDMCSITLALTDSYADGWNGGQMEVVDANTSEVYGTYTIASGGSATYELALCPGTVVNFVYTAGSYGTENGWVIYDAGGEVITEEAGCNSGCTHTNGIQATYTMNCSGCFKPSNLHATQVGTTSAMMNWDGENDSYVLQYRTAAQDINTNVWHQIGEDETATASHDTYTYDLSDYSGSGYVAIRHYNVTNMFYLDVDDITVTDPDGQTVLVSADGSSIPSDWTNQDVDGDGYVWSTSVISGYFVSQSYDNNAGELTPDNWLIIPVSNLGGTLSFTAFGQDANFPSEVFGVFVTTASLSDATAAVAAGSWSAEIPTAANSHELTGLTANTLYEWQVKGICDTEQTGWVSSTFSTLADGTKAFVTSGNWNEANNWFPVGVPTISDKVFIEANVTIPAGVVATANKVILNGGTITIQDGGQLKQNGSVEITFEKEIVGYGEGDANWYFIASPLTTTMLNYSSGWSYVNAITGTYDLYSFDPTHELEWINYKNNSAHANFTSGNNNPVLVSQTGYLYGHKDYIKLQFQGSTAAKSNNTVLYQEFTYDAESTDDWNGWELVGNPYTCNAYINYVDANYNVLDADFYTLNLDNTYSLVTSSNPLPPCTGALINYSATGKVQYSTEAPTSGKNFAMINMNLVKGNKTVDQARVRFGEGFNMQHMSFRSNSKVYMPVDNNEYAVVYAEEQGEMPVNFKAESNGTYTISFNTENVELGYLHLIDNMNGNDVDLLANPSYSFDAKTTDYESRFKLVFATGNADDNFAFYSNGSFVINNEGNATLQVIDINGRILKSESINGCSSIDMNAAQGVYMLRLVNGNDVKVQKVVVR